jgi:hypothetical protein
VHHRDILSYDYAWKLATHRYLKALELSVYRPKIQQSLEHPVELVIDRINQKLVAIGTGSDVRALWVEDSTAAVRAGNYHPNWTGIIQLLELCL